MDKYIAVDKVYINVSKYIRIHPRSSVCDAKIGGYMNSILASRETLDTSTIMNIYYLMLMAL